jgi:hypothetical protein
MNKELERVRTEAAVAYSMYYPGIFLNGVRKTTKSLSQDNISRTTIKPSISSIKV